MSRPMSARIADIQRGMLCMFTKPDRLSWLCDYRSPLKTSGYFSLLTVQTVHFTQFTTEPHPTSPRSILWTGDARRLTSLFHCSRYDSPTSPGKLSKTSAVMGPKGCLGIEDIEGQDLDGSFGGFSEMMVLNMVSYQFDPIWGMVCNGISYENGWFGLPSRTF